MYAARAHAFDMYYDNYFEHETYNRVGDELKKLCDFDTRIRYFHKNPGALSENIAMAETPEAIVQLWMDSKGHRENILDKSTFFIGVGFCKKNLNEDGEKLSNDNDEFVVFAVANFSEKPSSPIN
jgi:uncharacterized protein YkwD